MADLLAPLADYDLGEVVGWFGAFVGFGVGLSIVFWTLGYCVWFVIQIFR